MRKCLWSHPVSCSRELSRQEAQKDKNDGEGKHGGTTSDDPAALVGVEIETRFIQRGLLSGHDASGVR